ncbi:MAG: DUF4290 domain-containing protein [Rikenellaceae bacterium]
MTSKNYNSDREKLIFPEYGRHIQNMVRGLMEIENREERTRQAHIVINVMGNLNTTLRDTNGFRHKLWDHLYILSDYKLDVDFPYEAPTSQELHVVPDRLEYPRPLRGYRQYGSNVRRIINEIIEKNNSEQQELVAIDIVKFMKFKSYEYNQEYPSDEVVINDFRRFSQDLIDIDDDALQSTRINTNRKKANSAQPKKETKPRRQSSSTSSYGSNNSSSNRTGTIAKPIQQRGQQQNSSSARKYFRHRGEQ